MNTRYRQTSPITRPFKHKTLFVDVMLDGRFLFTMPYRYLPIFEVNHDDILKKVYEKRPSLKNKNIKLYID